MKKRVLIVIAPNGFQDYEYGKTKEVLEQSGIETVTGSKTLGKCRGAFGAETEAELSLGEVDASRFDGIAIIGGSGCLQAFSEDSEIIELIKNFSSQNKVTAAICIAPVLLAQSGILDGKKATVWNGDGGQAPRIEKYGAKFVDESVVVDGNIVTANRPKAAEEFGVKIVNLLKAELLKIPKA